jgi:hypothetical protein
MIASARKRFAFVDSGIQSGGPGICSGRLFILNIREGPRRALLIF